MHRAADNLCQTFAPRELNAQRIETGVNQDLSSTVVHESDSYISPPVFTRLLHDMSHVHFCAVVKKLGLGANLDISIMFGLYIFLHKFVLTP